MLYTTPKFSPCPISSPFVIFRVKEAFWDADVLYFQPLVLQEEVLLSGPAGGWILQPQLLQGWEYLQRSQRNYLPRLVHGCGSGKRLLKLLPTLWRGSRHFLMDQTKCLSSFRIAKCAGSPSSWRCRIRAHTCWLQTVKQRWRSGSPSSTRSSTAASNRPCRRRGTGTCTTVCSLRRLFPLFDVLHLP